MRDFPVEVPAEADFRRVETAVEKCCREMGLIQAMKGTLAKYPGCVHWHYKKPRVSGTLEVTSWPLRDNSGSLCTRDDVRNGSKRSSQS
jgi:hypothetical protein